MNPNYTQAAPTRRLSRRVIDLATTLLVASLLISCAAAPTPAPTPIPTESPKVMATEMEMPTQTPTSMPEMEEPTPTVPASTPTSAPMTMAMPVSAFDLSVAQFFLDTAGFHGMATTLAEKKEIDAAYLGSVNRVKKILVQTLWPEELKQQGQEFVTNLEDFAKNLEENNVDGAIESSEVVHDAQHELSHAIDAWSSSAMPDSGEPSSFKVSVAQFFLDNAGFHGMATTLADKKSIDATYLGTVNRVKKVLAQTIWPAELNEQAQEFIASLGEFAKALEANDVDEAIKTSDVVHDAQHELSHAIDEWWTNAKPDQGEVSSFNVVVAQYFLDTTGFHGMATTLADKKSIDATYLGKVNRVKKVLVQTIWPSEFKQQAQDFITSLGEFGKALEDNNVDEAIKTSETVHDAQHDLSHAIDEWAGSDAMVH